MSLMIQSIHGREIIDSRGNPTVEAVVLLQTASAAQLPSPAALRPDNLKLWSCAMQTPPVSAERACCAL